MQQLVMKGWCRAAISLIGLNVIVCKTTLLVLPPFYKCFRWALYQMDVSDDSKILFVKCLVY